MNERLTPYIDEVTETQGKLFDYIAFSYPESDTEDFINSYMNSSTRKYIDQASAYVSTLDYKGLFEFFKSADSYELKSGKSMQGFLPDWIGEFYSLYQYKTGLPSSEVIRQIPIKDLKRAYPGLHDLDLDLAVSKVLNT